LWANALAPTYGRWVAGVELVISSIACETRTSSRSRPVGSTGVDSFVSRPATTVNRFALPHRSP
jgi:hypothetical protein